MMFVRDVGYKTGRCRCKLSFLHLPYNLFFVLDAFHLGIVEDEITVLKHLLGVFLRVCLKGVFKHTDLSVNELLHSNASGAWVEWTVTEDVTEYQVSMELRVFDALPISDRDFKGRAKRISDIEMLHEVSNHSDSSFGWSVHPFSRHSVHSSQIPVGLLSDTKVLLQ